ncbi:MAG: transposase [Actinomycetia bacterium]|nr:transposase [Actinomycetes bacterium]
MKSGTEFWLEGVPPAKVAHFAGEARVLDAAEMGDFNMAKRLALLACLVHTARVRGRDDLAGMLCRRMAALHKRGRDKLEEIRENERAETERLWGVFGEVLAGARVAIGLEEDGPDGDGADPDASAGAGKDAAAPGEAGAAAGSVDGTGTAAEAGDIGDQEEGGVEGEIRALHEKAGELMLVPLVKAGGVSLVSEQHAEISAHHGNNYMPLLARFFRVHRKAMVDILDHLGLESTSSDTSVLEAVEFIRTHRKLTREFVPDRLPGQDQPLDVGFCSRQSRCRSRRRRACRTATGGRSRRARP